MSEQVFRGCGVALVTPFAEDGSLDRAALQRMVEHLIGGGVDFIVALGTTGEAVSQTRAECIEVLKLIHDHVDGRVPLIAGPFGGNSTSGLRQRFSDYQDVLQLPGYSAVMSSVPSYVKPNQEGLFGHFMAVADMSPLPVLLYNVPARTAVNMQAATMLRLAEASDRFLGVKEASGDMVQGMHLLRDRPAHFQVFSGDDMTALPLMALGAEGVISVIGNAYPDVFSRMAKAALEGRMHMARQYNDLLLDLHPLLYCDGNPGGIKAVLRQMGLCGDTVRLPLGPISDQTRSRIIDQLLQIEGRRAPAWAG